MIDLDDLEDRRAYRVKSRNLLVGFWIAEQQGFMGIRQKFGDRYLDTEYHYDTDKRLGTAHATEALDLWLPEDVEARENLDAVCQYCLKPTEKLWVDDERYHTGKRCAGDKHIEKTTCNPPNPYFGMRPMNKAAFNLLDDLDKQFQEEKSVR